MSLIEEAMRRVQDPRMPKERQRQGSPPSQEEPASPHPWPVSSSEPKGSLQKPSHQPMILVTGAVVGLTLALVGWGVFWMAHTRSAIPPMTIGLSPSGSAREHLPNAVPEARGEAAQRTPALRPSHHDELMLSGIVEGVGTPYAVVNGAVVGVGDRVGDATLVDIGHGMVRLRRADGGDTVLRVEH